jgi:hypothetical protein
LSRVLYRIATVLIGLLDLGHSLGYPWSDPAWGVDLHAVQQTHFKVLGFTRTYSQFYVGFGLSISILLLLPAITAWQLSNAAPGENSQRRITAWVLVLSFAALTLLNCIYFFTIPIVFSAAITLCLAVAALLAPSGTHATSTHAA